MIDTGKVMIRIPLMHAKPASIRPAVVIGVTSPYPTVENVTTHHQKLAGIDVYNVLGSSFSAK